MKVYKKRIYWTLYIYIIMLVCILVSIQLFLPSNYFSFTPAIITIFVVQFAIIIAIQWVRSKNNLIIADNSIVINTFSSKQELKFNDIKGFETHGWQHPSHPLKYILIKPNSDVKSDIKVHPSYINFTEIHEWVKTNFSDLDDLKRKEQHNKALKNHDYGFNTTERSNFVKRSKKVANTLNSLGVLLLVFTFFPSTYTYVLYPAMLVPIAAIIAVFYFKGLIKLEHFARYKLLISKNKDDKQKLSYKSLSVFTDVFLAITLPTILLIAIVIKKYIVLDHSSALKAALIIAIPLLLCCLFKTKEFQYNNIHSYIKSGFMFVFFYGFFYASIILLNCTLDNAVATNYESTIIHKSILTNNKSWFKSTDYRLKLKGVQPYKSIKITVSKEKYESQQIGNSYPFKIHKGKFDIPWVADNE